MGNNMENLFAEDENRTHAADLRTPKPVYDRLA
jgi:hypothetical protein